jgi:hypothetical protein
MCHWIKIIDGLVEEKYVNNNHQSNWSINKCNLEVMSA